MASLLRSVRTPSELMAPLQHYEIAGLDLGGSTYTVEQTGTDENFRPEYEARDVTGETIFRCTHQMYETEDRFPFVDDAGTELFTVTATGTLDIAGEYVLTDSQTGADLVVLDNDVSLIQDTWRLRDVEDDSVLAKIRSRGGLVGAARKLLPIGQFIGHRFDVLDSAGTTVGTIESDFAVLDEYEVSISDRGSVPLGPVLAVTVVVDAIQEN